MNGSRAGSIPAHATNLKINNNETINLNKSPRPFIANKPYRANASSRLDAISNVHLWRSHVTWHDWPNRN